MATALDLSSQHASSLFHPMPYEDQRTSVKHEQPPSPDNLFDGMIMVEGPAGTPSVQPLVSSWHASTSHPVFPFCSNDAADAGAEAPPAFLTFPEPPEDQSAWFGPEESGAFPFLSDAAGAHINMHFTSPSDWTPLGEATACATAASKRKAPLFGPSELSLPSGFHGVYSAALPLTPAHLLPRTGLGSAQPAGPKRRKRAAGKPRAAAVSRRLGSACAREDEDYEYNGALPDVSTLSGRPARGASKLALLQRSDGSDGKSGRSRAQSSRFRGVSRCSKDGRFQARIRVGARVIYLGRFKDEVSAAHAYDEAALQHHKDRAQTNFAVAPPRAQEGPEAPEPLV